MADRLSPWPEQRPQPYEGGDRARFAEEMSAHLPKPDAFKVIHYSDEDIRAIKAAYIKRFNEELPRTETMMCVASIGYRMALRDNADEITRLTEANEELIRGMTEMAERFTAAMDKARGL